jgi:hypothetical protein
MTDADIHAFPNEFRSEGGRGIGARSAMKRPPRWRVVLLLASGVFALLTLLATLALVNAADSGPVFGGWAGWPGWSIVIDDEHVSVGPMFSGFGLPESLLGAIVAALVLVSCLLLVFAFVVPFVLLVLLLVLGCVGLALGVALLAMVGVVALVLSPLWLVALFVWLVLRRRPVRPMPAPSAGMAA